MVKPTIEEGFDYTALHWADKPRPLGEVAGTFDPFPFPVEAPPLVPETLDEAAQAFGFKEVTVVVDIVSPVEQMKAHAMLSRRARLYSRTA